MLLLRHAIIPCQGWTHATVCLHHLRSHKPPRSCAPTMTLLPIIKTDFHHRMETLPILRLHQVPNKPLPLRTRSNDRHLPSSPSRPTSFAKLVSRTSKWSPICSPNTCPPTRIRNTTSTKSSTRNIAKTSNADFLKSAPNAPRESNSTSRGQITSQRPTSSLATSNGQKLMPSTTFQHPRPLVSLL
jgi:hypothetical protein